MDDRLPQTSSETRAVAGHSKAGVEQPLKVAVGLVLRDGPLSQQSSYLVQWDDDIRFSHHPIITRGSQKGEPGVCRNTGPSFLLQPSFLALLGSLPGPREEPVQALPRQHP